MAIPAPLRNNGKMLLPDGRGFLSLILLCAAAGFAQSAQDWPTCDNVNNTSASSRFRGSQQNAAPGNVSKLPIRSLLYRGSQTKVYTRYMPWFGDHRHRDVGYRSDDQQQVRRQVGDMISRGIQGAIVDWYGPTSEVHNQSTLLLMKESEAQNFEFAISEDAGSLKECEKGRCDVTQKLISDLNYAAEHFLSSPNYVRFDGRPALFFFGVERLPIDWRRVRHSVGGNPLYFFRNSGTFANPEADGAFAWIAPETANPGDPMGMEYLNRFYTKAQGSNKIAMGSAYKGFNDADASWGKGRAIDQQCGKTWLATFAEAGRFYSSGHQLPALIIPTWNDYEEGTEIETGIDNCVQVQATIANEKLSWNTTGDEDTIDHYSVLVRSESGWRHAADVPRKEHSIAISRLGTPVAEMCVEAVGRASLLNHFSGAIGYGEGRP